AQQAAAQDDDTGPVAWLLSAKTAPALRQHAQRLHHHLTTHPHHNPATTAHTLTTRTTFHHRAAIIATHQHDLTDALHALATEHPHHHLIQGTPTPGKTVFVFPGQGSQWTAMGLRLLQTSPVFAHHLTACDQALQPYTGWSPLAVLRQQPHTPPPDRVDVIQPTLFAVMIALARLWQHHGATPDTVIGHSQGEIAAAHIAGALTLNDAAKTIALRSQALHQLTGTGTMAAIPLPHHQIPTTPNTAIAAINSPHNTIISGDTHTITQLITHYQNHGINAKTIPVDYPSHSPHIEPLRTHILTTLHDITPQPPTITFHSTTHPGTTPTCDAHYWYDNLRNTVHLHTTTTHLLHTGHTRFIEISPHPILTTPIQHTIDTT
ncbi:acyltransferase domain-containing protein, partial [Actinomadura sp. 3N407]|uniref:acyltransferase domain-containing protein n=1 Tax=Actinomadura sp. 3N407 TaxID=3457423 RepID=UPI003FCDD40D